MKIRSNKGFTLIEVLIVIIVLATLAAMAIPMYQGAVASSWRAEATASLDSARQAMLRYWTNNNNTYATVTGWGDLDYDPNQAVAGQTVNFTYTIGGLADNAFTLTATWDADTTGASTVTIDEAGTVTNAGQMVP